MSALTFPENPQHGDLHPVDNPLFKYDAGTQRWYKITATLVGGGGVDLEAVRDDLATTLVPGTGVVIEASDEADTITFSIDTTAEAERARDTVAAALVGGANITVTHDDGADTITIDSDGQVARVSMTTPAEPQEGDLRWNPDADPPEAVGGGGTSFTASDVYLANKEQLQAGSNVTLVKNDVNETVTISASVTGSGSGNGLGWQALNAVDWGLSTGNSASANTTALRNAVEAACAQRKALFIPGGTYLVGNNCLTPLTTAAEYVGLQVFGEGMHRTILEMQRGVPNSYFFDNSSGGPSYHIGGSPVGNPQHLRRAKFVDIGFTGGPTDTGTQRANVNQDCLGFRLFGASDQSYKFIRCRFQTMAGVWESWGHNNASEIGWTDCYIAHISKHVVKSDNLQALNYFFWNCDVEIVWGDMFLFVDSPTYGAQGGGGSVGVFGGSWIIQRDGSSKGCVVKVLNAVPVTSVINFFGTRFEIRNDAEVVNGSAGGLLTVNFNGCNLSTIVNTGSVQTINIRNNQFVGFTRCTFEHNGSYATYVNAGGRLIFNECAVRSSIQNEVSTSNGGVSKAKDCFERFNFGNTIEWSE